ncbi:MAG: alpha/beta hydrolase [Chloroflexi bacterium]|nr:alpha/beta hydrolase [Chloroflexota bacterium]MDA1240177.1 alpha/beta hydrolase [Chloroflexota bacterium]MQC48284.1 alpha/beta hydrolase [Chloroflexota bacterium]
MTNGPSRFGLPRRDENGSGRPPGDRGPGDGDGGSDGEGEAEDVTLSIKGVRARQSPDAEGEVEVELDTTRGNITLDMTVAEGSTGVAVFLGGAGGGSTGPAEGIYVRVGHMLVPRGISSVRVRYREAGEWEECLADALAACSFLKGIGAQQVVMVGHSFGGAVAIKAGEMSAMATAVCSMSTQRFGTFEVEQLGKPLLLIHGSRDEVLDKAASEDVFERAVDPKRLVILPGGTHSLREHTDEVYDLLMDFVTANITKGGGSA